MTDLRILELRASNFARLKAVTIRPAPGASVKVVGANKQGKTSVLHAIEAALRGRAGAPAEPIRRGAKEAALRLDLGEVVIERTIKRGEDRDHWDLTVTRADGARIGKTPQAVIDAFYSALTIDPLGFVRAEPKQQADMLKRLVKGFDFAENAKKRQAAYDERTIANRRCKEQATLAAATIVPDGPKLDPVDMAAVGRKFDEAARHNSQVHGANIRRAAEKAKAEEMLDRAERLRSEAAQLERDAEELHRAISDSESEAQQLIDISKLQAEMQEAEQIRKAILAHETREAQEKLAASFSDESVRLTAEINALDNAKLEAIAMADLPAGLSLSEDGVLFNDLPFSQASGAEQMEVACAVAMALSPDLKVILVDGAERLDSHEMKVMEAMAHKAGYSIWCTIVDETGKVGVVIEDGEVKS
jgi:hypothetical protein